MKICVLMFYNDEIEDYGIINYKINKLYCDKYNLDLILSNEVKYNDRNVCWEKYPLLLEHINNYDYLIWVDADAFFYYDSNNIVDIINENPTAITEPDFNEVLLEEIQEMFYIQFEQFIIESDYVEDDLD